MVTVRVMNSKSPVVPTLKLATTMEMPRKKMALVPLKTNAVFAEAMASLTVLVTVKATSLSSHTTAMVTAITTPMVMAFAMNWNSQAVLIQKRVTTIQRLLSKMVHVHMEVV